MDEEIAALLSGNKSWAASVEQEDPGFFQRLAEQQKPRFLWIGCSDSRVPANQITGLLPGEVFVHRNVANLVLQTDVNCMSVVEFAISQIKVRHIIVCGHYGCAGVQAAMDNNTDGILDTWLSPIRALYNRHKTSLGTLEASQAAERLCELNVIEQIKSLCGTNVIGDAWKRGQELDVHGFVYGIRDGLLKHLGVTITRPGDLDRLEEV